MYTVTIDNGTTTRTETHKSKKAVDQSFLGFYMFKNSAISQALTAGTERPHGYFRATDKAGRVLYEDQF